ncbi:AfsR/SARP family transcriptional regulator [Lentzea flaviverrucosa]|uniref:DNA-binding transcriptional activator of the SARP family n=1 Tax=Lentzea flaviverrucosa TaxID=200379 RepID=A0A1H9XYC4_9PSEU|nr:BTAD domain-containing putative transcriptional regulator [Lentzea flaviverrucosa]RDI30166.1 DNA-binding SARP family transcriptional activator [Lentzea flaviverrucosa]SES51155.1 DNA-binding transcriptional activator of the SARP family [Lentzea flaviverrucosa]
MIVNVEFRVLGPLEVLADGEPVFVPAGRSRVLLATLLLRPNRFVSVDELVDRLWDGEPPTADRAHKTLQTTVLRLRQALGDANRVRTTAGGYLVEVAPEELDLLRFRELVRGGDFASATELWRGPALANVASDALHREDVPRLEDERVGVLERRIDADLDRGQGEQLVAELAELVRQHPLRERFWAQRMTALARSGRQAEALESYREITALLADELGVDPSPGLSRLHLALLNGEMDAPERKVICQLPPDTPTFAGREQLLHQVEAMFAPQGRVPVVVLSGAPGVGKSAFTIKAAHRLRDRFPDGQLFVRLNGAGSAPRDPAEVLGELLLALGVSVTGMPDGLEARAAAFRAQLADRAMLVVLDDAAGPEQVRPLLPGTAGCATLISSRQRLVQVEGAHGLRLPPLSDEDASALLESVIGLSRAATDRAAARAIVGACGGLPLALRVVGARLAARESLPLRSLAGRLSDERRRLDELATGDLEVRASFGPSYEALPADAATAFRRLGLLGAIDVAAWTVGVLAGGDGERLVERLVEANLVDEVGLDATGEPRYRMHDLLAVYAAELVREEPPEVTTAALRDYVDVMVTLADDAARDWFAADDMPKRPITRSRALEDLELDRLAEGREKWLLAEQVNVDRAVMLCLDHGWVESAENLTHRAFAYLDCYHPHERILRMCELVRDAAFAQGDELNAWRAHLRLLGQLVTRGVSDEVITEYARCVDGFEAVGAQAELACALGALAYFTMLHTGQPQLAIAERAVAAARASGVQLTQLCALRELGTMLSAEGRHAESARVLDEALVISRETGERSEVAQVLSRVVVAALASGDAARAGAASREAFDLVTAVGDDRGAAYCTVLVSRADLAQGDARAALVGAEKALNVFESLGERRGTVRALTAIAEANLALGLVGKAVDVATAALEDYADAGDADAEDRLRAVLERARRKA